MNKWTVINDELRSPHSGIILEVGVQPKQEKISVIDWDKFDWCRYEKESIRVLSALNIEWNDANTKAHEMTDQLTTSI